MQSAVFLRQTSVSHVQSYSELATKQSMSYLQVEYKKGWGKLKSGSEVEVDLIDGGSETLNAKNIIIATGSEVAPLPGIEIDEERYASPIAVLISQGKS